MNVGIRELKAQLSHYVQRAALGENIVVTDRGKPVAQLNALPSPNTLDRGIEEGWVEPAMRTHLSPIKRIKANATSIDVLDEDRG